ncbi:dipeptide/oligopeptide/nickel ABC transporter permease/ATP-binding protein [Agromyces sp. ISL-38]|uniref:dipeptide/oligopeptide/nickel ABC transporter permease/ATP-binding protein n=1 Tax=Agromyces sp. ISL-38 TaxID=2819107 RepID=UPI001BE67DDE|nr:dipeptide/oligopeptide/nickel ABC transporter permease/ATP-binding protein [Agromyces sp. ISL-38]MBT2498588.1 dipeptide/oligopeptide/nickel ABC transporter permease/ATP-binding protein [Agromyces sp. ISL-38]
MTESALNLSPDPASEQRAVGSHLARRMLRNATGLASMIVLGLIVLAAILAPLLTQTDPALADVRSILQPSSAAHPLGTDSAGRDVLARLLHGTRYSIAGALLGTTVAAMIGVIGGLLAGYYQKGFESVSSWLVSAIMALPGIVVLLAARAVLGPSLWMAMAVFGVLLAPAFYRLTYTAVVNVRHELFVDAARVSGVGDLSIIGRHILSVVRAPIIIQFAFVMGIAIAIQAGLDFLGLGDQSVPTWGNMLNDAFARMYKSPVLIVWPSLAVALTSTALALFANALRDELERSGKTKKRRRLAGAAAAAPVLAGEEAVVHAELGEDTRADLLTVDSLVVGYDQPDGILKQVVNGVSLRVKRGEVHGLIGESGSGKTQTAWSILRLLPDGGRIVAGTVNFDGKDLAHLSDKEMQKVRGRRISYIPQEPMSNLDPSFTVGSQLAEPMRLALGISAAEAKKRALELLARVGIPNPERTYAAYPHEVSGGMAQRVLIAGAVSCEPDLVIADEPTTALDVTVQAEILDLLRGLQKELGVSILIVTHNFGVVADLCDRVSVMRSGLIVETGPARSIFADPRHPYTQDLFAAILEDGAARGQLDHSADRHTATQGVTP